MDKISTKFYLYARFLVSVLCYPFWAANSFLIFFSITLVLSVLFKMYLIKQLADSNLNNFFANDIEYVILLIQVQKILPNIIHI